MSRLAISHPGQHGRDAMQHAANVDVDHSIPLVDLEFVQWRERHDARVVDQDIHTTMLGLRKINEGAHVAEVGHVERLKINRSAGSTDFAGELFPSIGAARAEHHERATLAYQRAE